jgi:hypothetical protein
MHSPLQARYPELSAKIRCRSGASCNDAAQFPGTLLRYRHAVLHRAFPFALFGENPPLGQWIFLRGGDGEVEFRFVN